jgi:hypothetical protein
MILLALGAVGDYVARTYEETKNRPLYVVTEICNVARPRIPLPRAVILAEPYPASAIAANDNASAEYEASYRSLAGTRA